jgi:hypothetical protein
LGNCAQTYGNCKKCRDNLFHQTNL